MATIKDVARESGYCISTVSYALMDNPKIPEQTRLKIKEVAKKLNYVPNAFARGLKTKKCQNIGVFIPGFKGPIHPTILSGIAEVIIETNNQYKMVVTLSNDDYPLIFEKQVDIAIMLDSKLSDNRVKNIAKQIPVILFDKIVEIRNVYNTYIDNKNGIKDRVIDFFHKGAKKFIYMKGSSDSRHNKERLTGFIEAINEVGLDINNQVVIDALAFEEESGYTTMKNYLLDNKLDADALVCANDELAIGSIKALIEEGYKIPEDIIISGFDNIDKGQYVTPSLSTINVNWFEYGKQVGNLALNILKKIKTEKRINIFTTLVDRESSNKNDF